MKVREGITDDSTKVLSLPSGREVSYTFTGREEGFLLFKSSNARSRAPTSEEVTIFHEAYFLTKNSDCQLDRQELSHADRGPPSAGNNHSDIYVNGWPQPICMKRGGLFYKVSCSV